MMFSTGETRKKGLNRTLALLLKTQVSSPSATYAIGQQIDVKTGSASAEIIRPIASTTGLNRLSNTHY